MLLMARFGVRDFLLLTGYLGEQIQRYFGTGKKWGLDIAYSQETTLLGTGGALKNAAALLQEEFLLLNGDTYLSIDYALLVKGFRSSHKLGMLSVYENSQHRFKSNVRLSENGFVEAYGKEGLQGASYVDAGAHVFRKDILHLIPDGKVCSLEEEIFPKLIETRELAAFPVRQRFYDMGSFAELEVAKEALS